MIFALRWGEHAHGSLQEVARECGVPYLLHPAGLNPSQIAWQVVQQVSGALQSRASCAGSAAPISGSPCHT